MCCVFCGPSKNNFSTQGQTLCDSISFDARGGKTKTKPKAVLPLVVFFLHSLFLQQPSALSLTLSVFHLAPSPFLERKHSPNTQLSPLSLSLLTGPQHTRNSQRETNHPEQAHRLIASSPSLLPFFSLFIQTTLERKTRKAEPPIHPFALFLPPHPLAQTDTRHTP